VTERFAYDDVPYDTEANAETHPSSMATLARLAGLEPAPPSSARVLEIGCGNGENLLAAATYLPRARFVGFDLAASAVAAGLEAARAAHLTNVSLRRADIRDVRASGVAGEARGCFDYVVAHGMYSWVPAKVREDLLAVMREALAPRGIGFLSLNALPGWELRRALRDLARDAARSLDDPALQVGEALHVIGELARAGKDAGGFFGALSAAAREYIEHVERGTPPGAPFPRYVFHDLLAEINEPFSVSELSEDLGRAGLRIVCETPLSPSRAGTSFVDLEDELARTGSPFLQVLVQRDDAPAPGPLDALAVRDLLLWADFTSVSPGTWRTSTGALVRPAGDEGLARATLHAPGFVAVRALADEDAGRTALGRQLFEGLCEGVLTLVTERPACTSESSDRPRVAPHVRARAASAAGSRAASAVLTNALHRSFRVPWSELVVVSLLDGAHTQDEIVVQLRGRSEGVAASLAGPLVAGASDRDVERFVATVIDRLRRHAFLVDAEGA